MRALAASQSALNTPVRPYTLRSGDSLESIATKRDLLVTDVLSLNPDLTESAVRPGLCILLPAGRLSRRDAEILDGIGPGYRLYPVRAGESLHDIISKRGISREEMASLNPGVNLDTLMANDILKLPSNKFTVREREMLIGSKILPAEFFQTASNPFVIGVGALCAACGFVLAWQKMTVDGDYLADQ